jgi:DtxR family Mn-dependent transcriptional regulator
MLSDSGLVQHRRYGAITLTTSGMRSARDVYHRHTTLLSFLTDVLGVDAETAREDACKLEHSLSAASVSKLTDFVATALMKKEAKNDNILKRASKRPEGAHS